MKRTSIITVGKIKTAHWQAAAEHYRKRLGKYLALDESQVKDADSSLPLMSRMEQEGERLLKAAAKKKGASCLICLDENGASLTSASFALFLQKLHEAGRSPCFIIGGAYGLAPQVLDAAHERICLGAMTFTHEMALVLLLEQLYRAENIIGGTGYHH